MSPIVTKSSRSLIRPLGTPPSCTLPLSSIDNLPVYRYLDHMVNYLLVFTSGHSPAEVISRAISRALDHYYPLAGRVVESSSAGGGDLEVACTGEGAWFVEASADCSLADVNYLDRPLLIAEEDLLPYPRPGVDPEDAIVKIQVTEFMCSGFAVTAIFNHVLFDGIGQGQFMVAIAELARGLTQPTLPPIWSRSSIPTPPLPPLSTPPLPPPILTPLHLQYSTIDLPLEAINHLKTHASNATTFEVLAAKMWQCWTRVAGHDSQAVVQIGFPVNLRPMLVKGGVLPADGGFYGNCLIGSAATATSGEVAGAAIAGVADMIREAKERAPVEFWKWARGELEEDPHQAKVGSFSELLFVVDWRRMGFAEVDFGWGSPDRWGPLMRHDFCPSCVIVDPPKTQQGARLVIRAVNKEQVQLFIDLMMDSISHLPAGTCKLAGGN